MLIHNQVLLSSYNSRFLYLGGTFLVRLLILKLTELPNVISSGTIKEFEQMESKLETEILRCFDSDEIETLHFDLVTEPTNLVFMFVFPASTAFSQVQTKKIADVVDIAESLK